MKRNSIMMLAIVMILVFTACGSNETTDQNVTSDNTSGNTEVIEQSSSIDDAEAVDTEATTDMASSDFDVFSKRDKMKIESTYEIHQSGETQNMSMTFYVNGKNMRIEGNTSGSMYMLIYNDDEKTTYMVNEADKSVLIMGSGEESGYDSFGSMMGDSMSEESYTSLDEIDAMFGGYELMNYNGVEAIYVETTSEEVGDEGDNLLKMWISKEFGYPIHSEIYEGDELIMEMNATVSDDFEITDDLFLPPSDYTIMDMNSLYNMDSDDAEGESE